VLFSLVEEGWPASPVIVHAERVRELMSVHGGPRPNVDFALAALVAAAGMSAGAGEAIFAVARIAGWLAHAIEEYPHRTRYRPRAVYVGDPVHEPPLNA
jgi:citrate synthase